MECFPEDIVSIKECFNQDGKIYLDRCYIRHRDLGVIAVKHNYEYLKKRVNDCLKIKMIKIKGFKNEQN